MGALIAIVGRPNVGKSALFNRIAGRRIAIVHDQPGVTRDRVSAEVEWLGRKFTLVDTGGIGLMKGEKAADVITQAALDQVELAIEAAQVIILTVNAQEGVVPLDREVAGRLQRSGKPVLVAANKVDNRRLEPAAAEFAELGFGEIFPLTAIHGMGVEELMSRAMSFLPQAAEEDRSETEAEAGEKPLKLTIVGRPNVGKSSIINALTRSDRVVVSPIPGTTRDAVDVPFEVETEGVRQKYVLVDTAGVRQERRIDDSIEFFSVKRTEDSIERADIVVLVLDAETGISMQDKKIGGKILDAKKACIVVVNKWDLADVQVREAREEEMERRAKGERGGPKRLTTLAEFGEWVQENLFFLDYAPVIFTSAKTGFHLERLLEAVRYVGDQLVQRVPTSILNRTLQQAIERRQPISAMGHHLKFFYATQVGEAPPTFLLFVNRDELFSPTYTRYLAGEMRKAFGFEGVPLVLVPKPRPKTIEPVRKRQDAARKQKVKVARSARPKTKGGAPRGKRSDRPGRPGRRR